MTELSNSPQDVCAMPRTSSQKTPADVLMQSLWLIAKGHQRGVVCRHLEEDVFRLLDNTEVVL